MRPLLASSLLVSALACVASRADAQDLDVMTRWTNFTVVRYVVVGAYAGDTTVFVGDRGWRARARVTDRVKLTFDWNQNETALVGTPTIENFASTMSPPTADGTGCPAPRVTGSYDHWKVVSATPMANTLQLTGTRSFPAGAIPYVGDGSCVQDTAAAKTEPEEIMLVVVPAMMLGMGTSQGMGAGMSISTDGKSIVYVDKHSGWTWTYTPTGIR